MPTQITKTIQAEKNYMDQAAENGQLELVQLFYKNRETQETQEIKWFKAGKYSDNDIEIKNMINKYRHQNFTANALIGAVKNGHLGVVRYLHMRLKLTDTANLMIVASIWNRLDILKWLHMDSGEVCPPEATSYAVANNNIEVLRFLESINHQYSSVKDLAIKTGGTEILAFMDRFNMH